MSLIMNKKNFLLISFLSGIIIPLFCNGTAYRLTTAEINTLNTNQTAVEDRNYFDTDLQIYKKGLADGTISAEINRDTVRKTTSEIQTIDIGKTATELLFYFDTAIPRYFFGKSDQSLEPLIVQNLFSPSSDITNTEVLDTSGLRNQAQNGIIQPGRAYEFDGSDDYVDTPFLWSDYFNVGDPITISAWFKTTQSTDTGFIIGANPGGGPDFYISIKDGGFVRTRLYGSSLGITSTNNTYNDGEWHHVVMGTDGTNAVFYIDNIKQPGEYGTFQNNRDALAFGRRFVTSDLWYDGQLHDVQIYDRAISTSEITALSQKKSISSSGLIAHYKMDESAGTTAYDSSGNGNHGTITNATLSTFHTIDPEGSDWQNQVGYTDDEDGSLTGTAGVLIPRNESNTSKDVLGNDLEYQHRVNYNTKLVESNCGNFDGTNDYIEVADLNWQTDDFQSFSFFFKLDADETGAFIGARDQNNNLIYYQSNEIRVVQDGMVLSASISNVTDWHHVAVVLDDSRNGTLYIDGVSVDTTASPISAWTSDELVLGSYYQVGSWFLDGQMSSVNIFNRELTQSEVFNLSQGKSIDTTGIIAHYPLAEGAGTTIYDASGNGNHGTATDITEANFWGETQDVYHYNLREGFSLSGGIKIPAQNSNLDAQGNVLTNPASKFHNGAETKILQYPAPELIRKDTNNVYFDANGNPLAVGYDDFISDMSGDGKITSKTLSDGRKKNVRWLGR